MAPDELESFLLTEAHQQDVITILAAHMSRQDVATQIRRHQLANVDRMRSNSQVEQMQNNLDAARNHDFEAHDRCDTRPSQTSTGCCEAALRTTTVGLPPARRLQTS